MGSLNYLSVNAGDITLSFDTNNGPEAFRAKEIIEDMLKRGYALFIKFDDGRFERVRSFDSSKGEYLIAGIEKTESNEETNEKQAPTPEVGPRRGRKRVKFETANVTAVAPTAGG